MQVLMTRMNISSTVSSSSSGSCTVSELNELRPWLKFLRKDLYRYSVFASLMKMSWNSSWQYGESHV